MGLDLMTSALNRRPCGPRALIQLADSGWSVFASKGGQHVVNPCALEGPTADFGSQQPFWGTLGPSRGRRGWADVNCTSLPNY